MPADPSALFPSSSFFPYALGLFGLGTCYFVWGGQSVFNFPRAESEPERTRVNRTMGLWGIWMGGFLQFLTHSRVGLARAILGCDGDAVVQADDLPVVLVHPHSAQSAPELDETSAMYAAQGER